MVKKIIKIILILAVITILTLLLVLNYQSFPETTNRLLEIKDIGNLQNIFDKYLSNNNTIYDDSIKEIIDNANEIIENIKRSKPLSEVILDILSNTLIFTIDFINYFLNIGFNLIILMIIFFHETFNGTNLKIKYTKAALIFIKSQKLIALIMVKIKDFLKYLLKQLSKQKRKIALIILLILISNGFLYKLLTELLIFFITYIYHVIKMEVMIIFSSLGQAIFLMLYPKLKYIPYQVIIIILLYLILIRAFQKANYKLTKNHEHLKKVSKEKLTQTTFINGVPGIGKTLLNLALSLASEEVYIETLRELMLEYELKFPYLNFATIRNNPEQYPMHKEYLTYYEYLYNRDSLVISNYSIYSPYYQDYSKIFDFYFMRKNIKAPTYALEEYIIISLSELDKEYNSHDDMKAVGEDGAATFFSTISHDLKRHVKLICDYQLKDQVPLRIRGNAEYILTIKKRQKKYPILLFIYYSPFIISSVILRKLITRYETKRTCITRKTKRKGLYQYKRNDYNLTYAILRSLAAATNKICAFFNHYWYFKLKCILTQGDNDKGENITLYINICDLKIKEKELYDSTFLSYAYEEKKNMAFKDLPKFSSLRPTIEELTLCHSRFYNKLNGVEQSPLKRKKTNELEDEYIEINQ